MFKLTSKEQFLVIGLVLSLLLGVTAKHFRDQSPGTAVVATP